MFTRKKKKSLGAGTLESFYRDGALGRAIYGSVYGSCFIVGTWAQNNSRALRFTRCWLAKVGWDVEASRHRFSSCSQHLSTRKQTETRTTTVPSILVAASILSIETHDIAKESYQDMHFCFGGRGGGGVLLTTCQNHPKLFYRIRQQISQKEVIRVKRLSKTADGCFNRRTWNWNRYILKCTLLCSLFQK